MVKEIINNVFKEYLMTWRNNLEHNSALYHKCCIPTKKI